MLCRAMPAKRWGFSSMLKGALIFFAAWTLAYGTVQAECNYVGAFLVGTHVFECKVRR